MTAISFLLTIMLINGSLNFLSLLHRSKYSGLDSPIDLGLRLGNNRLIGNSTTFWGLILSIAIGELLGNIFFNDGWLGLILSIGVYTGHGLGSFIKRRLNYKDGEYLPIIDHGDYVITAGLIFFLLEKITLIEYAVSVVIVLLIHPLFCLLGYKLKIRDRKL